MHEAPRRGAGIEIHAKKQPKGTIEKPLAEGLVLKSQGLDPEAIYSEAPRRGAGIEIVPVLPTVSVPVEAPRRGAGIEITAPLIFIHYCMKPLAEGLVLKLPLCTLSADNTRSPSQRGWY